MARRRIVYRGAWWRAARRGILSGLFIAATRRASPRRRAERPDRHLRPHPRRRDRMVPRQARRLAEAPMSTSTPTDRIAAAVAEVLPEALELSHRVHANPEIAYEERQAAAWTAELLERHGFEITPSDRRGWRRRSWRGGRAHGPARWSRSSASTTRCPRSATAAATTSCARRAPARPSWRSRALGDDFAGEVRFIGTPAEEAGSGKVTMIERGRLRRRRRGAPDPPVGPDQRRDRLPGDRRPGRHLPRNARSRQRRSVARPQRARRARAAVHDGRPVAAAPEAAASACTGSSRTGARRRTSCRT